MKVRYKINYLYALTLVVSLGLIGALWSFFLHTIEEQSRQDFADEALQLGIELSDAESALFFRKVDRFLEEQQLGITSPDVVARFKVPEKWFLIDYQGEVLFHNFVPEEMLALITPTTLRLAVDRMEVDKEEYSVVDNYETVRLGATENLLPVRVHLRVYDAEQVVLAHAQGLYSVMARIAAQQRNSLSAPDVKRNIT